jgi:hypothetical protein
MSTRSTPSRVRGLTAIASLALLLAACVDPSALYTPEGEPYVRGPIEAITAHATATGLLVLAGPGSQEPCGIQATADDDTRYLRRTADGTLQTSTLSELSVGDTVEVYVEGPIAESCPVQGRAAAIILVPADS